MNLNQELFAVKLYEMEKQYGKLLSRIRICGQKDRKELHEELQKAVDEYREHALTLQKDVESSRSKAVAELARTQLECSRKMEELLTDGKLEEYLHSVDSNRAEDRAEAVSLYAEFAIDYAVQTMQYALISALSAMELQLDTDKPKGDA
ncbi:MAG: hypothetical protein ACOX7G_10875 [Candidatus Scatomorpha sp.]|jgi:murein L,D-transpeptidase YcbB/YkuD